MQPVFEIHLSTTLLAHIPSQMIEQRSKKQRLDLCMSTVVRDILHIKSTSFHWQGEASDPSSKDPDS